MACSFFFIGGMLEDMRIFCLMVVITIAFVGLLLEHESIVMIQMIHGWLRDSFPLFVIPMVVIIIYGMSSRRMLGLRCHLPCKCYDMVPTSLESVLRHTSCFEKILKIFYNIYSQYCLQSIHKGWWVPLVVVKVGCHEYNYLILFSSHVNT